MATASTGVSRCATPADLRSFVGGVRRRIAGESAGVGQRIAGESPSDDLRIVLQEPAPGPLAMVQTVWCRGELVAAHVNERVLEGAGGGAARKRSLDRPDVVACLAALGSDLGWHGALCADVILTPDGPVVIDVNPRLVEPANAAAAGVDLVGALVEAAFDRAAPQPASAAGVETHQLLLAALGAAQRGEGRRAVVAEAWSAARRRGAYAGSREELTPVRGDRRAALPVVGVVAVCAARPSAWRWFAGGSVAGYALSPDGWDRLVTHAAANGCAIGGDEPVG